MTTSWGRRTLSTSSSARRTGRRNMKCSFQLFLHELESDLFNHLISVYSGCEYAVSLHLLCSNLASELLAAHLSSSLHSTIPAVKMYFSFLQKMIVKLMPLLLSPYFIRPGCSEQLTFICVLHFSSSLLFSSPCFPLTLSL